MISKSYHIEHFLSRPPAPHNKKHPFSGENSPENRVFLRVQVSALVLGCSLQTLHGTLQCDLALIIFMHALLVLQALFRTDAGRLGTVLVDILRALGAQAFMSTGNLYRISIPASVKSIGENAFSGCNKSRLTIVAPYGSVAEQYAIEHGIQYSNSTSVQIQPNSTSMYVGEQKTIGVLNTNKEATWKSSNTSVATVDATGLVKAKKAGNAKISATIGGKTYRYTCKVVARTQSNVLKVVWDNYVTSSMSDYEKAVAAEQWVSTHIDASGTSSSVKNALESGKVSYTGRANTYKKILEHYGLKVKVVKGSKQVENSVVIAGKTYKVSALSKVPAVDKSYTTTPFGVAINKSTMNLSVGGTDTFKTLGTKQKVTYSSSNKKVATVTAGGKVTAKGAGTATVTMKMGAKTYKLRVRVNK